VTVRRDPIRPEGIQREKDDGNCVRRALRPTWPRRKQDGSGDHDRDQRGTEDTVTGRRAAVEPVSRDILSHGMQCSQSGTRMARDSVL
jgi:hypothetical protein